MSEVARKSAKQASTSKSYVHFTSGGIKVDLAGYLRSPSGQKALDRAEDSLDLKFSHRKGSNRKMTESK